MAEITYESVLKEIKLSKGEYTVDFSKSGSREKSRLVQEVLSRGEVVQEFPAKQEGGTKVYYLKVRP